MPEFVLNRNHVLQSTLGHTINFHKGKPTYVPPELARAAVAIGAEQVEGNTEMLDDEPAEKVELSTIERQEKMFEVFNTLMGRTQRGDFDGQGVPAARAVVSLVGFDVDKREITEAWRLYEAAAAEKAAQ